MLHRVTTWVYKANRTVFIVIKAATFKTFNLTLKGIVLSPTHLQVWMTVSCGQPTQPEMR